jgi:hypothetical protein
MNQSRAAAAALADITTTTTTTLTPLAIMSAATTKTLVGQHGKIAKKIMKTLLLLQTRLPTKRQGAGGASVQPN